MTLNPQRGIRVPRERGGFSHAPSVRYESLCNLKPLREPSQDPDSMVRDEGMEEKTSLDPSSSNGLNVCVETTQEIGGFLA